MEPPRRATARAQRLNAVIATCLLAAAAAAALGRVFIGAAASWRLVAVALASALLSCVLERRNLLFATLVSTAGLVVAVGLLIFPQTTLHGLPTLQTLHAMGEASRLVGQQARERVAPTLPLDPLMLAAVTAVWAATFSGHALAFRASSPLLALLPPIALVAFADTVREESVRPLYGLGFLVAALALMFADGLRRVNGWGPVWTGPGRTARLSSTAARSGRRMAGTVLALAAMAPILVPGFGSKGFVDLGGGGRRVQIDPLVSMAALLSQKNVQDVFVVNATQPTFYRMLSLSSFDGKTWRSSADTVSAPLIDGSVPLRDPTSGVRTFSSFTAASDLGLPWLALPSQTIAVSLSGYTLGYSDPDSAVTLSHGLDAGATYGADWFVSQPTPDALRQDQIQSFRLDPGYAVDTALPVDTPRQIGDLAAAWTKGATTPYDKIIAIQNHLRGSGEFTYDPTVEPRDDSSALLDFLTNSRRGFCQQFSAAMAVMLRAIDIPSRVVVGFTGGARTGVQGSWKVTTRDAHSWVEVRFPGYGWLTFDPTPGSFSDPVANEYWHDPVDSTSCPPAAVAAGGCTPGKGGQGQGNPVPVTDRSTRHGHGQTGDVSGKVSPTPAARGRRWPSARRILAVASLIALVGLALVPVLRRLRRRLRLARATHDHRRLILTTYDVFTERAAELGFPRGAGETLEEYRRRLAAAPAAPVNGHLDRLTGIAMNAAYAPHDPGDEDARAATDAANSAWKDIRRGTPLLRRLSGAYRLR